MHFKFKIRGDKPFNKSQLLSNYPQCAKFAKRIATYQTADTVKSALTSSFAHNAPQNNEFPTNIFSQLNSKAAKCKNKTQMHAKMAATHPSTYIFPNK